jgi:hypothetical protein
MSSKDGEGLDIVLSASTKAKIQDMLVGCGELSREPEQENHGVD